MKYIKSIIYTILSLTVVSCDSYFDIDGLQPTVKLVLYSLPVVGRDTTIIQLSKSVPVSGEGQPQLGFPGGDVKFAINGEPKAVFWNEERKGCLPGQCYYTVAAIKSGDKIGVSAELDGFPVVTSETVVPEPFKVEKVEMLYRSDELSNVQTRVTFTDPSESDDYYAVRMVRHAVRYNSSGPTTNIAIAAEEPVELNFDDEPIFNNKVGLDATLDFDYDYEYNLYIWTDEQIQGHTYTLKFSSPYQSPTEYSYTDFNGVLHTFKFYYQYKLYLYHLSPEFYNYLKLLNDSENNHFGKFGLAPLRCSYTNVKNGFGIVGGSRIVETGWALSPDSDHPVMNVPIDSAYY